MRYLPTLLCFGLALSCGDRSDGDDGDAQGGLGNTFGGRSNSGAGSPSHAGSSAPSGGASSSSGGPGSAGGANTAGGANAAGSANTGGADPYGDARIRCVDRTNALRATKGLAPIPRLASAESCVDGQAKSDSESGKPHGAFDACLDQVEKWKGVAQNECPGYRSVESALGGCLDAMWAEGPGGGHYDNMVGNSTHTACGFYTTPEGKVWMVQDFWTE
jgi:hypothetical protein